MDSNFPTNLSIRPSHPSSSLCSLIKGPSEGQDQILLDDDIILSQSDDIEDYGIAGRIWEAAYAMTVYLNPVATLEFDPQCSICDGRDGAVVELGSGNGFLGLKIAQILSSRQGQSKNQVKMLVLTDLETVCPLLERNCQNKNFNTTGLPSLNLVIQALEWGNLDHGWRLANKLTCNNPSSKHDALLTHIVCSDLVYFPELFTPLLRSLLQLSSPPFSTAAQPVEVIISYMIRSLAKESPFWAAFGTWFNFSPVLDRRHSMHWKQFGDFEESTMFIFIATRKPETLSWTVPDDVELMCRGNDVFETLLLMNLYNGE